MRTPLALRRRSVPLKRALFGLLMRLVPPTEDAVVYGFPDEEENSLRVAHELSRSRRTTLLVEDSPKANRALVALRGGVPPSLQIVTRSGIRPIWRFLRAGLAVYTHGLYGSPEPGPRRLHVNVWHGHGPKKTTTSFVRQPCGADVLVANTSEWGKQTASALGMESDSLLLAPHPRQDAFAEAVERSRIAALDLIPSAPFVVWLPTYRETNGRGLSGWSDGAALTGRRKEIAAVYAAAQMSDVQLVVKPHPLDADDYASLGLPVVGAADLLRASLTLYQLLALSSGLITDYSSVWVDYLASGRPIGLYCPDLSDYRETRGFKTPALDEIASSLFLEPGDALTQFFHEAAGQTVDLRSAERRVIAERLGVVGSREPSTPALITQLQSMLDAKRP